MNIKEKTRSLKVSFWKWINTSKIVLAVVMFTLGASLMFDYIEGKKFYNDVMPMANYAVESIGKYTNIEKVEAKELDSLDILVDKIGKLESDNGQNQNPKALHNYCKDLGKSNNYGYGGMSKMWCYTNDEKAREIVKAWFKNRFADGYSEAEAVCFYRYGKKTAECKYLNDFNSL